MKNQDYLIFELNNVRYGIDMVQVKEVFKLPEFFPVNNPLEDVIGILNVRNSIIPVIYLSTHLSSGNLQCHVGDSLILLNWQGLQVGVIANQIHDIQSVDVATIQPISSDDGGDIRLIAQGLIQTDDMVTLLLNPETFIRQPNEVAMMVWEFKLNRVDHTLEPDSVNLGVTSTSTQDFVEQYCPQATEEEQAIFRQRALNLNQSLVNADSSSELSLAVIKLGQEHLGIFLDNIREFTNIPNVTSIPGYPDHILGNINLRGEIITLMDIRQTLGLPLRDHMPPKAVILEMDNSCVGMAIDEVLDIIDLLPTDLLHPSTDHPQIAPDFSQGVIQYYQHLLTIIDLPQVFFQGNLLTAQVA